MTSGTSASTNWNTAILYGYVVTGSVIGSVARYLVSLCVASGLGFPWATLFVNITGSFAIGFYSTLSGPDGRLFANMDGRGKTPLVAISESEFSGLYGLGVEFLKPAPGGPAQLYVKHVSGNYLFNRTK